MEMMAHLKPSLSWLPKFLAKEHNISNQRFIEKAFHYMIFRYYEKLELDMVASEVKTSRTSICRIFRHKLNITPMKWIWFFRVTLAHEMMQIVDGLSLTEIAFMCGFNSSEHFSRTFKKVFRSTPSHKNSSFRTSASIASSRRKKLRDLTSPGSILFFVDLEEIFKKSIFYYYEENPVFVSEKETMC